MQKHYKFKHWIIISALILSFVVPLYYWIGAEQWVTKVMNDPAWYQPEYYEFTRGEVDRTYRIAFYKSLLVMVWVFGSMSLVLKVNKNND